MSKWISEAYIKMLMQTDRLLQGNCEYKLWEQEVEKIVDAMPSIDIVRCKECKRRKKNGFCLEHNRYEKNDNGYCSDGDKRDD